MILAALLFTAILTCWIPERWPVALLQCGVFALAIVRIARPSRCVFRAPLIPLAGAAAWGIAQIALHRTVYAHDTWEAVLLWTANLALCFVAMQAPAESLLRPMLWFGFLLSLVSTLQWFTGEGNVFWIFPVHSIGTPMGPFLSRNQYAAFIELVLPLALVRRTLASSAMAAAMYASVIASASRAGAALVTAEVLLILALQFRRGLVRGRTLALVLALVAVATAVVGAGVLWNRWTEPQGYAIRWELLRSSLDMARERPAMGFGLGTWATAYPAYAYYDNGTFANQAHDDWVQWAAEGGLPFFLLMLLLALWSLRPALRSLWGLGILAVFLHALVDYPFQKPALAAFFFTLAGLLAAAPEASRKPHPFPPLRSRK